MRKRAGASTCLRGEAACEALFHREAAESEGAGYARDFADDLFHPGGCRTGALRGRGVGKAYGNVDGARTPIGWRNWESLPATSTTPLRRRTARIPPAPSASPLPPPAPRSSIR